MLSVEKYKVGPLETNCYFIIDDATKKSAIVDPGGISAILDKRIEEIGKENVEFILLTHGHFDHIRKAERYRTLTDAKILIGEKEAQFTKDTKLNLCRIPMKPFDADHLLHDGEEIVLGKTKLKVMTTPGHTIGGICFIADDLIFSGDTIMKGTIGRCDLATGDIEQMMESVEKISALCGDYTIYPGHGEKTTLESERQNNVYFRRAKR